MWHFKLNIQQIKLEKSLNETFHSSNTSQNFTNLPLIYRNDAKKLAILA